MAVHSSNSAMVIQDDHARKNNLALIVLAILYFLMGFVTVLNDTLVPFFKEGFTLTYAQSSLVQFYFFLTYGLISIPAGKVVEKLGYNNSMVIGFVIAGIGAVFFYPASIFHEYTLFLMALFIIAIGIVILQVAANPYITVLGKPETAASRLTLIQGVGSIGTTVAPLFGAHFILSRLSESKNSSAALVIPYLFIGLSVLIVGMIVYFMKLPRISQDNTNVAARETDLPQLTIRSIARYRNLKYGIVALFLYVGAEVAIGTFLTNYISDKLSIAEDKANLYLSFYWGGMLVGRFIGSYFLKFFPAPKVLSIVSVLASLLIAGSLLSAGSISVWCMVSVGLCNSIMFAIIFSLAVNGLGSMTTRASGYLSTAIVGGAIVSYSLGLLKDHFTWVIAFIIPILCYLFLFFYGKNGYKVKEYNLKVDN